MASALQKGAVVPGCLMAGRSPAVPQSRSFVCTVPVAKQAARPFVTRPARRGQSISTRAVAADVVQSAVTVVKRLQGKVYVAGISGQLSSRIVKDLLQAGVQVIAGVPEGDPAAEALDFAVQFELIKKQEASKLQIREIDPVDTENYGIPRGATVVVVLGDTQGRKRVEAKQVDQAVDAAVEAGAGRIVLVTPIGGSLGGGGLGDFFSFFGGAASSGSGGLKLSKPEQKASNSGLPYSIVRIGAPPRDEMPPVGGVEVTAAGDTSRTAQLTRTQAADVVTQVILQVAMTAQTAAGESNVVEVGVSPATTKGSIAEAVAEALPSAEIGQEDEDEEEEEAAPIPQRAARAASRFARPAAAQQEEDDDEEEEEAAPASPALDLKSLFGGRGAQKAQAAAEEAEEAAEQAAQPMRSLFGGRPQQAKQEAKAGTTKLTQAAAASGRKAASAASRGAQKAAPAARQQSGSVFKSMLGLQPSGNGADAEDEEEAPKKQPFRFGGGTRVLKAEPPAAKAKPAPAKPSPKARPAPKARQAAPPARQQQQKQRQQSDAPAKKQGGFLQALGISQETTYVDED